jgi:hypothetical protein
MVKSGWDALRVSACSETVMPDEGCPTIACVPAMMLDGESSACCPCRFSFRDLTSDAGKGVLCG